MSKIIQQFPDCHVKGQSNWPDLAKSPQAQIREEQRKEEALGIGGEEGGRSLQRLDGASPSLPILLSMWFWFP